MKCLNYWIWQVDAVSQHCTVLATDKAGATNVALVKATKHKANAATNEVRVENRSHGLA